MQSYLSVVTNTVINTGLTDQRNSVYRLCNWVFLAGIGIASLHTKSHAFPLSTEDTGILETGRTKLEYTVEYAKDNSTTEQETSTIHEIGMTYGYSDTLEMFASLPYTNNQVDTGTITQCRQGISDGKFGIKWQFYSKSNTSLAFKLGTIVPTGDDDNKLGNGFVNPFASVIVSHILTAWEYDFDIGYTHNYTRNPLQEEHLWHAATAIVYRIQQNWNILAEIVLERAHDTNANQNSIFATVGVSIKYHPQASFSFGIRNGVNSEAPDHTLLSGVNWSF